MGKSENSLRFFHFLQSAAFYCSVLSRWLCMVIGQPKLVAAENQAPAPS